MRNTTNSIDLSSEQLHLVRELLREHIPHAEVWAYGSRVRWTSTSKSDLDMVAHMSKEENDKICALREAFDESSLPFHVDFFVWDDVPEEFHAQIKKEFFILQGQLKDSKLKNNFIPLEDCLSYTAKGITPKYLDANGEHAILVLNQKCNRNFNIDFNLARFHNTQQKKVPVEKILNTGDVLINSTGTGTAGRVAQILSLPEATTVDSHMIILRSNEHFDTSYFGYAIKYNQREIEFLAEGSTGQTEINRKRLSTEIKIFFPPLHTQKQIAHVLSTIDKKIELNQRINENLEQQAQAIFKSMFPAIFKNTLYNRFADFIVFANGKKRPLNTGSIPVYGGNGILAYTKQFNFFNGAIIGRVGAYCGNVFLSQNSCWVSDNAIAAKCKISDKPFFLYYLLKNASLQTQRIGTGQPLLTQSILKAIKCNLPNRESIYEFNSIVSAIFKVLDIAETETNRLISLRDTLLPKLMSGEIAVSQVKI